MAGHCAVQPAGAGRAQRLAGAHVEGAQVHAAFDDIPVEAAFLGQGRIAVGAAVVGIALSRRGVHVLGFDAQATGAFLFAGAFGCGLPILVADRVGIAAPTLTLAMVFALLVPAAVVIAYRAREAMRAS